MFNSILKEHRAKSVQTRKQLDSQRAAALASAELVTHHLFHEVHTGLGLVYQNQRVLANEASCLQAHTNRFAKQSERWLSLSTQLNNSLKELGDVQNWALTIQKDVRWIEHNLQQTLEANNQHKMAIKEKREEERRKLLEKQHQQAAASQQRQQQSQPAAAVIEHVSGADEELP